MPGRTQPPATTRTPQGSRARRQVLLACCRPDGSDLSADPKLAAAVQELDADPALRQSHERQSELDARVAALIGNLPLPDDLAVRVRDQWARASQRQRSWRGVMRDPAFLAALLALCFLLGWAGWYWMERANHFPGDEALTQLLDAALPATRAAAAKVKFHPVANVPSAQLGDTLFLENGFDAYAVPDELAARPATGYRVFKRPDGVPVAHVLLAGDGAGSDDTELNLFIFRAADLGIVIEPPGAWRLLAGEGDRWAAAVQVREDELCIVIVSPGDTDDLRRRLAAAGIRP